MMYTDTSFVLAYLGGDLYFTYYVLDQSLWCSMESALVRLHHGRVNAGYKKGFRAR